MDTIGLDLADKNSTICVLDAQGEVAEESRIATTARGIERYFKARERARVVLELGTHSPWVSRQIAALGHEVIVANPRRVKLIAENNRKSDQVDAELLARLGRADPKLLAPVRHRGKETQEHLALIRARDVLVRTRSALVNAARSLAKSQGVSVPSCSADSFHNKARLMLPPTLRDTLEPLLATIHQHTQEIHTYDKRIDELCETTYAETEALRQIVGVGAITALCFVLTLEDPGRFANARAVGAYLGLTPGRRQSGEGDPRLRCTKAGDPYLRRLLVQCAQYIMGPFGPDTALRRWGLQRIAGAGSGAKKRAIIAIARKLSIIMYRLWVSGDRYEAFPRRSRRARKEAA